MSDRLVAILIVALLACGGWSVPGVAPVPADDSMFTQTWTVAAAQGGLLALPDGTSIAIQPGALSVDTTLTLTSPKHTVYADGEVLASLVVEPHDVVLSVPARVTVAYDPARVVNPAALGLVITSRQHAEEAVGSERTLSVEREDIVHDPVAHTVGVDVTHFSIFHLFEYPDVFVARDLPTKFLRAGDLLYAMTDAAVYADATTRPMHVGILYRPIDGLVVESTIADKGCTDDYGSAVEPHALDGYNGFKNLCMKHIYLGARRPSGWTEAGGLAAADYAWSKIGTPYGMIGLSPVTIFGGVSCVELAEDAWEEAGVNVSMNNDLLLTPWDQYIRTSPVRRISIDPSVDKEVRIPIIAALRHKRGKYAAAGYDGEDRTLVEFKITPSEMNPDARIEFEYYQGKKNKYNQQAFGEVVFRPGPADYGKDVVFDARLVSLAHGYTWRETNFLQFEVGKGKPGTCPWQDSPDGQRVFIGTFESEALGVTYRQEDVALTLAGSAGALWVSFDTSAIPGDFLGQRKRGHGYVMISGYPPAKDFMAGSSPWYSLARGPIDPNAGGPSDRLGGSTSYKCNVGGREDAFSPDTGGIRFDLSPDCQSVVVTLDLHGPNYKGDATCDLTAKFSGVAPTP